MCRTCEAGRPADGVSAPPVGGWQEQTCRSCNKLFLCKTWQEVGAMCRRCSRPRGSALAGSGGSPAAGGGQVQPPPAAAPRPVAPPLRCLTINCQNGVASAYWHWADSQQHVVDAMVHGTAARMVRLCAALERVLPDFDVLFLQEIDAENGMLDPLQR
eukprot:SAG22_NODE_622_length_8493_cov_196.309864_5_plen_158_part_00